MRTLIVLLDKSGGNVIPKLLEAIQGAQAMGDVCFGLCTSSNALSAATVEELSTENLCSPVATGFVASDAPLIVPLKFKTRSASLTLEGRIFPSEPKANQAEILRKNLKPTATETARSILECVEGEYALIISQTKCIVATRDPVGVQPLYFGEVAQFAALASNRAALWRLGIDKPKSFPPGHVGEATAVGFKFTPVKNLQFTEPKLLGMAEAAATLQKILEKSVQSRVAGQNEVAVAFSGGLDSSIVACLAKKAGACVRLIHVSMLDQSETEDARKAAGALGLPLDEHLFTENDAERDVAKVVSIIEEPDPVKAAIGLPFYWAAKQASEAGLRVMLAGQGADELFGGYHRYIDEYMAKGDLAVRRTMFHDVNAIHESNLERDEKICSYFDVQLRIPFGSLDVAQFAMSLPTELKLERKADSLRKLILRRIAENIGLPKEIAAKPKKAVQYSTGINNTLKKIAKKRYLTLAEYVSQLFFEAKYKTNAS